jgi:hypothetical protein
MTLQQKLEEVANSLFGDRKHIVECDDREQLINIYVWIDGVRMAIAFEHNQTQDNATVEQLIEALRPTYERLVTQAKQKVGG